MSTEVYRVGDYDFYLETSPYYPNLTPAALVNTGLYFQNRTGLDYSFQVLRVDGGSMRGIQAKIYLNGQLLGGAFNGGPVSGRVDMLTQNGSNVIRLEAVKVGSTDYITETIDVYPLFASSIQNCEVYRCLDDGTKASNGNKLYLRATQQYASVNPSGTELNVSTIKFRYKTASASDFGSWINVATTEIYNGLLPGTFPKESSYTVEVMAESSLAGSMSFLIFNIPTDTIAFHMRAGGKGVCIGGYAETDGFTVKMDSTFENPVAFNGNADFYEDASYHADAVFGSGATFVSGDHVSSIEENSGSYDALKFFATKGQSSDSLWYGKRGGTVTALAPYENGGTYLGFSNYRFARVYTDSIGLGGSNPLIASSGSQDVHLDMAEANYGLRYGVTDSMWALYPRVTNQSALGTTNKKWTKVYATTGTIQTSDKREKKNIEEMDVTWSEFILDLKPCTYEWKKIGEKGTHAGFIAQEVRDSLFKLGLKEEDFRGLQHDVYEDGSDSYGLNYAEFIAPMVHLIQEQQKQIDDLNNRLKLLEESSIDDCK